MRDHGQAFQFLSALYDTAVDVSGAHMAIWTTENKRTQWMSLDDIEKIAKVAVGKAATKNVYFGIGLHRLEKVEQYAKEVEKKDNALEHLRGFSETVVAIPGLWVEIDIKHDVHKEENLPANIEEVKTILSEFPLEPTILIHSGHGVHAWYLFNLDFAQIVLI